MIPEQTNNLTEGKHGTVSCLNLSSGLWKYTIYLTPTPYVHVIFPYSTLCTSYTRVQIYAYMWSRACYTACAVFGSAFQVHDIALDHVHVVLLLYSCDYKLNLRSCMQLLLYSNHTNYSDANYI